MAADHTRELPVSSTCTSKYGGIKKVLYAVCTHAQPRQTGFHVEVVTIFSVQPVGSYNVGTHMVLMTSPVIDIRFFIIPYGCVGCKHDRHNKHKQLLT